MKKLKVGIAGYGIVGKRRHFFIDQNENLETVAVCDKQIDTIKKNEALSYYSTYKELLEHDIDILFVCLSNDMAAEVTIAGLEKGLHVFCEKPPGRNVKEIQNVIDIAHKHPELKLKYGFNHRYHAAVQDALNIVRSKELGEIINMRGVYGKSKIISYGQNTDWRTKREMAGGGILLDQGIHMLDLMHLFVGEFKDIYSFISNDFWKHDVEDNAYALMRTSAGQVAMLHSSATQWRHRFSLDISLEKGSLILGGIITGSKSYGAETLTIAWASEDGVGDPREQTTRYNHDHSWANEIDEFTDAITHNKAIIHGTSDDALKTMKLVYDIYRADPKWSHDWQLSRQALEE